MRGGRARSAGGAKRKPRGGPKISNSKTNQEIVVTPVSAPLGMAAAVRRAALHALTAEGVTQGELDIAFVDQRKMCQVHAEWLADDTVTDVITFDLAESATGRHRVTKQVKPSGRVDGQIVVCTAVARCEARLRKITWQEELLRYVVHGCLHLCGYDDVNRVKAARMYKRQEQLMREITAAGGKRHAH